MNFTCEKVNVTASTRENMKVSNHAERSEANVGKKKVNFNLLKKTFGRCWIIDDVKVGWREC